MLLIATQSVVDPAPAQCTLDVTNTPTPSQKYKPFLIFFNMSKDTKIYVSYFDRTPCLLGSPPGLCPGPTGGFKIAISYLMPPPSR